MPLAERFPRRATSWRLRQRKLELPARPLVMGILNITPDSFSDGGQYFSKEAAIGRAHALVADGADILDIGGESTRPYSEPVDEASELARVLPVIEAIRPHVLVPISIDTSKALVAREAIAAGAEIINDITALQGDGAMVDVALATGAGLCVMHMQGTPQTMQDNPCYDDVVEDVLCFLRQRQEHLVAAGVDPERIALDPGIGFGKSNEHNLILSRHAWRLHELGSPVLVGPSRKTFIGKVIGDKTVDRTAGTVGVALSLATQGVQIVRVHDVAAVRQALLLFEATGGIEPLAERDTAGEG